MTATRIESIFHPSDFSEASEIAFVHALRIALVTKAALTMLHVDPGCTADWSDFPGVRSTLERWNLIARDSARSAVADLGIAVQKIIATSRSPVRASLNFLDKHPADLIVLAVHQYEGSMRWQHKRVAEPIAHANEAMTLYLPQGVPGFVSRENGSISLRNILIPVARKPRPQPAVAAVARMISALAAAAGQSATAARRPRRRRCRRCRSRRSRAGTGPCTAWKASRSKSLGRLPPPRAPT